MKKQLWAELPDEQRIEALKDHCEGVEDREYLATLTEEELEERRRELVSVVETISEIEREKKEALKAYKGELDLHKGQQSEILEALRLKGEKRKEELYKIIDHEEGVVGYYTAKGKLVEFRKARPDEKQTRIRSISNY